MTRILCPKEREDQVFKDRLFFCSSRESVFHKRFDRCLTKSCSLSRMSLKSSLSFEVGDPRAAFRLRMTRNDKTWVLVVTDMIRWKYIPVKRATSPR
jgi:hypothetical protein